MVASLHISAQQIAFIEEEATTAFPAECCGLLVGTGESEVQVTDVIPAANQAEDPNKFLIDPQVQFDWLRKLRGTSRRILGHYHSHPNGHSQPSDYDAQMAHEAGQVWLIVGIISGRDGPVVGEMRVFVSQGCEPRFLEVPIERQP